MKVNKDAELVSSEISSEDMELINGYAKKKLEPEEVFTFSVLLCDNEVDRDNECFSSGSLYALSELFVGKTGILDHNWSSSGQMARIYRTEVVCDRDNVTSYGVPYSYLKGYAYMIRTEDTDTLIREIEGGIKKEVSVGCGISERICNICGESISLCPHEKGVIYDGKACFAYLEKPYDAYEWSFVAVPAQKNAGVIKRFGAAEKAITLEELFETFGDDKLKKDYESAKKYAELGKKYMQELTSETVRLGMMAGLGFEKKFLEKTFGKLGEDELLTFKRVFEEKLDTEYPLSFQLAGNDAEKTKFSDDEFMI